MTAIMHFFLYCQCLPALLGDVTPAGRAIQAQCLHTAVAGNRPVQHMKPALACATAASGRPVLPFPSPTSGVLAAVPAAIPGGRLIDTAAWEGLSPLQLMQLLMTVQPPTALSDVIGYAGPDLVAAAPMPAAELAALYQRPAAAFVAGQGFKNKEAWLELVGSNAELRRWVQDGYSELLQGWVGVSCQANNANTADHVDFVTEAVKGLVDVKAVSDVTHSRHNPSVVHNINPLTVAVWGSGKLRLCYNARPVNPYFPVQKFKMEHIQVALSLVQPGDLLFAIDMQAGYHQIPLKPFMKQFMCFEWQGRVYRWDVLPFGLATAPRAYSRLGKALLKHWRAQGIRCSSYIDDFFFAVRPADLDRVRQLVLADLSRLGWYISDSKALLQAGTMVKFLGFQVCSVPAPHVRVPDSKIAKLRESLLGILRRVQQLPSGDVADAPVGMNDDALEGSACGAVRVRGRTLARLLGFVQSCRIAIPLVPVASKALYDCLGSLPLTEQGWVGFGDVVELSPAAVQECAFWYQRVQAWNGSLLRPRSVSRVLYTDASGQGYGGVLHRVSSRVVEPALAVQAGVWEDVDSKASVHTELKGLWRSLVAAGGKLVGQSVLHRTDSISTYYILKKGGSRRNLVLDAIASQVMVYCAVYGITLSMQYVGAGAIILSGADALSRRLDETDCKLNPVVMEALCARFGAVQVDRFATAASVQSVGGQRLPYWGLFADGLAEGVDSLSADWRGVFNYAFPPVKVVGEVLRLVAEQQAKVLLIVPRWESQWWWPMLQHMASELVPLAVLAPRQPVLLPARAGGLPHPLGTGYRNPHTVVWMAALVG